MVENDMERQETVEPTLFTPAEGFSPTARKDEWQRYYSPKRIQEQLLQVRMLGGVEIDTVLEVGPYFGLVTAMLDNAGYEVTTLDMIRPSFARPQRPHIEMNLMDLDARRLEGFDCIMCCATLEHIPYDSAVRALEGFRDSGARYVLISLPYQGLQMFFQLYWNRFTFREMFSFKKFRFLRQFEPNPDGDPHGHKWEIGYKGYSLRRVEAMLRRTGFTIRRRDFSFPSYCVFHLLENTAVRP